MDWTLAKYNELCAALVQAGYQGIGMSDYMTAPNRAEKIVLLRHDVDSRPAHSLKMGEIENQHGLKATYFYRTVKSAFDPSVLKKMHALGHEVGYHYETLAQANGNIGNAISLFEQELARMRQFAPITSVSMHGSPLHPYDNRDIWQHTTPDKFNLCGEVYLSIDYTNLTYLSDTGRTWHPTRYNVRDHTTVPPHYFVETTDDLISLIRTTEIPRLCLLTHPERWQSDPLAWRTQQVRDTATNLVKLTLIRLRG